MVQGSQSYAIDGKTGVRGYNAVAEATLSSNKNEFNHNRAIGHPTSEVTLYVVRKTQSGVTPAHGRMKFQMTALGIVGSRTIYLDLKVRDHQYWVETNL